MASRFTVALYGAKEFQPLESWRPEADGALLVVCRALDGPVGDAAELKFVARDRSGEIVWAAGVRTFAHPDGYPALIADRVLPPEEAQGPGGPPAVIELSCPEGVLMTLPLRVVVMPPATDSRSDTLTQQEVATGMDGQEEEPEQAGRETSGEDVPPRPEPEEVPWPPVEDLLRRCEAALRERDGLLAELEGERAALAAGEKEVAALRAAAAPAPPTEPGPLLDLLLGDEGPAWLESLEGIVRRMRERLAEVHRLANELGHAGTGPSPLLRLLARLEQTRRYYQLADLGWLASVETLRARRALLERYFGSWGHVLGDGGLPAA
jgi:hypothetical protein